MVLQHAVPVKDLTVHAFKVPTDGPDGKEQDGTLTWESVTIILAEARGGDETGIGYTYGDVSTAALIDSKLAPLVKGADAMAPPAAWRTMQAALRNVGQPGIGAMAVSAVDIALWDLKARLLGQPLYKVLPGLPRRGACLWQRRLHQLSAVPADRTVRRMGRSGHPADEAQDLP